MVLWSINIVCYKHKAIVSQTLISSLCWPGACKKGTWVINITSSSLAVCSYQVFLFPGNIKQPMTFKTKFPSSFYINGIQHLLPIGKH